MGRGGRLKREEIFIYAAAAASLQSCLTLCNPTDGSPPGSTVPGILQARTRAGCHFLLQLMKMKVKSLSCVQLLATPWTAAYQAPPSMGFSRQEYWSGGAIAFDLYMHIHTYLWLICIVVWKKPTKSCRTIF